MRAQITVLKKAMTEEQWKNCELRDTLKEKDQRIGEEIGDGSGELEFYESTIG